MTEIGTQIEAVRRAHGDAGEAAENLASGQMHRAAVEAGFLDWVGADDNKISLKLISDDAGAAFHMPFPSPAVSKIRSEGGFDGGIATQPGARWTLGLSAELDASEPYDTGVQLLCFKQTNGKDAPWLSVPLDLTIPSVFFQRAQTRPDRLVVQVGERQLPNPHYFHRGQAQRLLLVANRFVEVIRSGQAANLDEAAIAPRGLKRFLNR